MHLVMLFETLIADIRRGWGAPVDALMTGKLTALAISVPVILLLFLAFGLNIGVAVGLGAVVQLLAGYAIAGREVRKRG